MKCVTIPSAFIDWTVFERAAERIYFKWGERVEVSKTKTLALSVEKIDLERVLARYDLTEEVDFHFKSALHKALLKTRYTHIYGVEGWTIDTENKPYGLVVHGYAHSGAYKITQSSTTI